MDCSWRACRVLELSRQVRGFRVVEVVVYADAGHG